MRLSPLLISLFLTLPGATATAGNLVVDAGRGPISVQIPAGYDPAVPAPLVLLLHGYGASGPSQEAYMQFGAWVDTYGFLFAFPSGLQNPLGDRYWNGTDACCDLFGSGVDDVAYLTALIDAVKAQMNIDPTRVHLIGHSNGGFMSYHMACARSEEIASIASLAGATFDDPLDCSPGEPVHVLQIHGTADSTILYGGGTIGAPYPGAVETVEQWAGFGGCSLTPDTSAPPLDLVSNLPGAETTVARYESACNPGGSAELWTIAGGSHVPSLTITFRTAVLDFLFAHPKPAVGTEFCTPSTNSTGLAGRLAVTGSDSVAAQNLNLVAFNTPPAGLGLFIVSNQTALIPFGDGFLCLGPPVLRITPAAPSSDGGEARRSLDFSASYGALLAPGSDAHFQYWYRDVPGGPAGFNLTTAVSVSLQP